MQIRILDRTPKAEVPEYATLGSGGMDIRSPNNYVLPSRKTLTIPTGLAIWIEDPKFCGMLLSLVVVKIEQIKPKVVDEFDYHTERGTGGFGSTGE